jgi:hypothetical protein
MATEKLRIKECVSLALGGMIGSGIPMYSCFGTCTRPNRKLSPRYLLGIAAVITVELLHFERDMLKREIALPDWQPLAKLFDHFGYFELNFFTFPIGVFFWKKYFLNCK